MKTLKNAKYNQDYSRPLTEAQKSVAKGLYIPVSLRDKFKAEEDKPVVRKEEMTPVEE